MIQDKTQPAGNGLFFSRTAPKVGALGDADWIIWMAPAGRAVKASLAVLRLLTRTGPLPARRALQSMLSRLAVSVIISLKDHQYRIGDTMRVDGPDR